jgi:hypothetical protein
MILLEREWLASGEPEKMLAFLKGKASKRKMYLFQCAAIHRLGPLLTAEQHHILTDIYQKAETMSGPEETLEAYHPQIPFWRLGGLHTTYIGEGERWARAKLLRDIFGPLPFRSITVSPAVLTWNDGTLPRLALVIYEDRKMPEGTLDPARLAILADALEEAGCTNQDILCHCRSGGEHVRGCWVVDLVLGKE